MYLQNSYKNPFDRKSPATCGSSFQSSMQVGVLFCLRIFHDFASSQFRAIFHRILTLRHCFLLCFGHVWVNRAVQGKGKMQKAFVDRAQLSIYAKYHRSWKSLTTFLKDDERTKIAGRESLDQFDIWFLAKKTTVMLKFFLSYFT